MRDARRKYYTNKLSRATKQTHFLAATRRDEAICAHFVVVHSLFGATKRRRSLLELHRKLPPSHT